MTRTEKGKVVYHRKKHLVRWTDCYRFVARGPGVPIFYPPKYMYNQSLKVLKPGQTGYAGLGPAAVYKPMTDEQKIDFFAFLMLADLVNTFMTYMHPAAFGPGVAAYMLEGMKKKIRDRYKRVDDMRWEELLKGLSEAVSAIANSGL